MYVLLYTDGGKGEFEGFALGEMYVVGSSGSPGSSAKWVAVPRPPSGKGPGEDKWGMPLLGEWLRRGKERARFKTTDLFKF